MSATFGELLRAERRRTGRTLADVAAALDLSIAYISDIERGMRKPPSDAKIRKMAECLGSCEYELLDAAANARGGVELEVTGNDRSRDELATSLARTWSSLPPDVLDELRKLIEKANRRVKK